MVVFSGCSRERGVTVSSSINRFPWQDDILRSLRRSGETTVGHVTSTIAAEGVDSDQLDRSVAENLEHLVHMHLAVYRRRRWGRPQGQAHADRRAGRRLVALESPQDDALPHPATLVMRRREAV